jgi:hypothetical protein
MFGAKAVKVCCGPRCGSHPGHRGIYDAVDRAVEAAGVELAVVPTMCRSRCGDGVTVVGPDGTEHKARDAQEARALAANLTKTIGIIPSEE